MPRIINFPTFTDERGNLTVYDTGICSDPDLHFPFIPKRVFWIYGVPSGKERADHAHEICEQIIIPLAGEFIIEIDDGNKYYLKCHTGLYVETGYKIRLYSFSKEAICLVLCSEHYDENETLSKDKLLALINEIREELISNENARGTILYLLKLLDIEK